MALNFGSNLFQEENQTLLETREQVLTLSQASFNMEDESAYDLNVSRMENRSGVDKDFFATVMLPHNSTIISCTVFGDDATVLWDLNRRLFASTTSLSLMSGIAVNTEATVANQENALVDNLLFVFYIRVINLGDNKEIKGARIRYLEDARN